MSKLLHPTFKGEEGRGGGVELFFHFRPDSYKKDTQSVQGGEGGG
jgi:hypothetical protein